MTESVPAIRVRNLSKSFSGRKVLSNFDLDLMPGEIHGLVGQNGSGKSTFIKILSGYHNPDPDGSLQVNGSPVELPLSPADPARLGMSFVHQDLALVENGTITENLRIGRYGTSFAWYISWKNERLLCKQALVQFGLSLDPDLKLSHLSQIDHALVAILRALEQIKHATVKGVLILDEPTSYLPRDGVDRLFKIVREIASLGHSVLFVSHRLEEVLELTNRVTVLRDGKIVGTYETSSLNEDLLIQHILGFALEDLYPESHSTQGEPILSVKGLEGSGISNFSLEASTGEVIGLTGLLGMGQDEILYLLFGAKPADQGEITVDGQTHRFHGFSPAIAIQLGIGLVPANRLRDGGSPLASAAENMTLASPPKFYDHGRLKLRRERQEASELMEVFDVRPREPEKLFNTFSGGNQQKALLAKWITVNPKVLLLHEPSQGVDVGARKQIFGQIRRVADQGTTVLIASTEYEDLSALCNRVFIFRDGRVVSQLSQDRLSRERILEQCYRNEATKSKGNKG